MRDMSICGTPDCRAPRHRSKDGKTKYAHCKRHMQAIWRSANLKRYQETQAILHAVKGEGLSTSLRGRPRGSKGRDADATNEGKRLTTVNARTSFGNSPSENVTTETVLNPPAVSIADVARLLPVQPVIIVDYEREVYVQIAPFDKFRRGIPRGDFLEFMQKLGYRVEVVR